MATNKEKVVLLHLLNKYRDMPYLWNKKHLQYLNKSVRNEGYNELLEIYKQYDDEATVKNVKKKLENMRTNFLKEWKKVKDSELTAVGPENIYVPSLWYFDKLMFLKSNVSYGTVKDNENTSSSTRNDTECDFDGSRTPDEYKVNIDALQEEHVTTDESIIKTQDFTTNDTESDSDGLITPVKKKYKKNKDALSHKKIEFVGTAEQIMKSQENDWEIVGKSIGVQLKDLNKRQLVIARKLISDVIYYASLDRLSEDSKVISGPQSEYK